MMVRRSVGLTGHETCDPLTPRRFPRRERENPRAVVGEPVVPRTFTTGHAVFVGLTIRLTTRSSRVAASLSLLIAGLDGTSLPAATVQTVTGVPIAIRDHRGDW